MKKNVSSLNILVFLSWFAGVQARVEFATRNSHVIVKNLRSGFTIAQPKKVFGWSKDSIVTDIDQRSAEQWEEHYQEGATVGDQGTRTVRNLNALQKGWYYEDPLGSIIFQEPYPAFDESYLALHRATSCTCDLAINNSNAIILLTDMLAKKSLEIATNSNAIVLLNSLIRGTSNALLALSSANSNTLLYLTKNNSNALSFGIANNSNTLQFLARNNSNAITITREELGLIGFGKLESMITVNTNPYSLFWPLLLGEDARLIVPMNATVDGRGLFIDVPQDIPGVIDIAAGDTLKFNNIELRNFNDAAFVFGNPASNVVFGDRTTIYLGGCQSMSFDWSFTGETVLDGQGSTLDLNSHIISISSPGTLTIKDINLIGVKNNNIRVVGENGTVEFKSAALYLESDFTMTAGAMRFTRDVTIVGTSSFVYATGRASTISAQSTLFIGNGTTLNYSPSVAHRDLIVMEDETAALYLNGCTLSSTTTGLRLTTGTLLAEHKNVLLNAGAVSLSESIEFGNGTAANDLNIEILPGASFEVQSGILNYNNTF